MERFLWVCLGGAMGTGARYLLSLWLLRVAGPGFPWATLTVNVTGSFLLGLLMQAGINPERPALHLALTTGVLGGFTTYSTLNYETLRLFQEDVWLTGFVYLGTTVAGCLAAGALGFMSGRLLVGS